MSSPEKGNAANSENGKPVNCAQIAIGILASFGGFVVGTIIGWSSPAESPVMENLKITSDDFSWIASIMPVGGALSQILTAISIHFLGMKYTVVVLSALSCIAWILFLCAQKYAIYIVARFLNGFFAGGLCVVCPGFVGEIAHKSMRGLLSACFQLNVTSGILFSYAFGYVNNVFVLNVACLIPAVVLAIAFFFTRESPMYLMSKSKEEEATKSLQFYRGKGYNVATEIEELKTLTQKSEKKFWEVFKEKACLKAFLLLFGMHVLQQLTGINVVMFYAHKIFIETKTNIDSKLSAVLLGIVQVVATMAAVFTVDRLGRKILWYISLSLCAICLAALGLYFTLYESYRDVAKSLGVLPTVAVCLYICGFSFGSGPLPWVLIGEILPNEVKAPLATFVAFVNWMLAFGITLSFPYLIKLLGKDWPFYIYGLICVVGIAFVAIFCIETKNKSLQEIQDILRGEQK